MELGQKLRQARLEAGLSQRQLCGDVITRNMLSQIENGSARPSMQTLQYLAQRLGKPMGYFLEAHAVTSPNQMLIAQARQAWQEADWAGVLRTLETYRLPDPVFDPERWLLETRAALELARQAIAQGKGAYAEALLARAERSAEQTPYADAALTRQRLLLSYRLRPENAPALAPQLPDCTEELLLRAECCLGSDDPKGSAALLDAAPTRTPRWQLLRGECCLRAGDYAGAATYFSACEADFPRLTAQRLELCHRELGDYKMAYHYACLRRELD